MLVTYDVVCRFCGSAGLEDMGFVGGSGYIRRFYCGNCKTMWKLSITVNHDLYAEFEYNKCLGVTHDRN